MRLSNKLTSTHINFHNNIMNVKLATQLLSRSVADSMIFCQENLVRGFGHSGPTAVMNNIFDILNARDIRGKALKAPIRSARMVELLCLKLMYQEYLSSLKVNKTTSILNHSLHTGFLGLLSDQEALLGLSEDLLMKENPQDYLLPFKVKPNSVPRMVTVGTRLPDNLKVPPRSYCLTHRLRLRM